MSDRWQYVVGGIISLVLAMGYLTLTDEAPSGGQDIERAPFAPDNAALGAEFQASPSVAAAAAPSEPIGSEPFPAAVGLPAKPALTENNDPAVVLALPSAAAEAQEQGAALGDHANSESPAPDSTTGL